ncbi:MAG: cytochrome c [Planctomycetes bacterium]|nr:cytochrome c [Planctomycetota bacterium]
MTARPLLLVTAALALVAPGFATPGDETAAGHDAGNAAEHSEPELPPHSRAPHQVDVTVHDDAWLLVNDYDTFGELAEADPERFEFVEGLLEPKDESGEVIDTYDGYRDKTGRVELRYDPEAEDVAYFERVSAERLTRGHENYIQYCASCHGLEGDGYGRSAQHLRPPPRDFRVGKFKFTKVGVENLPSDQALVDLVKKGLDGTPMYPWALTEGQLLDVIQYIKSLSPPESGWRDVYAVVKGPVDIGEDPWTNDVQGAVARGEIVYHNVGCFNCHPGYVTPARIDEIVTGEGGIAKGSYREDLTLPKIVPNTMYQVQGYKTSILPPDFTWHSIRAGRDRQGNLSALEIARTVGSGIAGSGMPQWKGSMPDKDIWAIGYYVRHLIETYHGKPQARAALMSELRGGN